MLFCYQNPELRNNVQTLAIKNRSKPYGILKTLQELNELKWLLSQLSLIYIDVIKSISEKFQTNFDQAKF